jgi:hypothetical protein
VPGERWQPTDGGPETHNPAHHRPLTHHRRRYLAQYPTRTLATALKRRTFRHSPSTYRHFQGNYQAHTNTRVPRFSMGWQSTPRSLSRQVALCLREPRLPGRDHPAPNEQQGSIGPPTTRPDAAAHRACAAVTARRPSKHQVVCDPPGHDRCRNLASAALIRDEQMSYRLQALTSDSQRQERRSFRLTTAYDIVTI